MSRTRPKMLPPERLTAARAAAFAEMTRYPNRARRPRTYPRVIKRARHNSYRVKRATDTDTDTGTGTRHHQPPSIRIYSPDNPTSPPPLTYGHWDLTRTWRRVSMSVCDDRPRYPSDCTLRVP